MTASDKELEWALNNPVGLEMIWKRRFLIRGVTAEKPTEKKEEPKGRLLQFKKPECAPLKTVSVHDGMTMEKIFAAIQAGALEQ